MAKKKKLTHYKTIYVDSTYNKETNLTKLVIREMYDTQKLVGTIYLPETISTLHMHKNFNTSLSSRCLRDFNVTFDHYIICYGAQK